MTQKLALIRAPVELHDPEGRGQEYSIFDIHNPRSVVNIVPLEVKIAIQNLDRKWRSLSETELHRKVDPDPLDAKIRLSFWDEYANAQDGERNMISRNILRGLCSEDYWKHRVLLPKDGKKLAYIITPPHDYLATQRMLLNKGLKRWEEILELPIIDKKTKKPDVKLIGEITKIVKMLDDRVTGAVAQKVQVEQKNLNMNFDAGKMPDRGTESLEDVERELAHVRKRIDGVALPESTGVDADFIQNVEEGELVGEDAKTSDPT